MNLTISGHHLEITPAIRSHVESKLDRMKRNFDGVIDISVLLAVDNVSDKERSQRAEIKLNLSGKTLHAESTAQDLYAAIDLLMDKLDRQLVKAKTKSKEHSRESVKNMPLDDSASSRYYFPLFKRREKRLFFLGNAVFLSFMNTFPPPANSPSRIPSFSSNRDFLPETRYHPLFFPVFA